MSTSKPIEIFESHGHKPGERFTISRIRANDDIDRFITTLSWCTNGEFVLRAIIVGETSYGALRLETGIKVVFPLLLTPSASPLLFVASDKLPLRWIAGDHMALAFGCGRVPYSGDAWVRVEVHTIPLDPLAPWPAADNSEINVEIQGSP